MKKILYFISAVLLTLIAGCSDNELIKPGPDYPVGENEVPFGAVEGVLRTGETKGTRTIYEIGLDASGQPQHYDKYTNLRISWENDDTVRVYSPEAPVNYKTANYVVKPQLAQDENYASNGFLAKVGANGIHWGKTGKKQNFYAFYPGNSRYIKESLKNKAVVDAFIPVAQEKGQLTIYDSQTNALSSNGDWKIINPDMEYCMMAAQSSATPNGTNQAIELTFKPLITVFDIVINGPQNTKDEYKILSVSLRSKTQNIVGPFTYQFTDDGKGNITFPENTSTDYKIATIDCMSNGIATSLKGGQKLNLKFFLLPRQINSNELSISVLLQGGRVLTKSLGGNKDFAAGKIIKIKTPKLKYSDTNNWMSLIDDDVYFASQLSLPGTKHSYSYKAVDANGMALEKPTISNFGDVNTKIMNFYQTKSIQDQFNSGVRAFDIKVTTRNNYAEIYAGGKNTEIRLSQFLNELSGYLNPTGQTATEAAVVTINYVYDQHQPQDWLSIVLGQSGVLEMTDASSRLKKVTSEVTMGEMRGKIGIMVLYPGTTNTATQYTSIVQNYSSSVQDYKGEHIDKGTGLKLGQNGNLYYQNLYQVNNPEIIDNNIDGVRQNVGLCPHYILSEEYKEEQKEPTGFVSLDLIDTKKELIARLLAHSQTSSASTTDLFMNDCAGFCVVNDQEYKSTGWGSYKSKEYVKRTLLGYTWYEWANTINHSKVRDPYTLPGPIMANENNTPKNPKVGDHYAWDTGNGQPTMGQGGNTALFAEKINPALQKMIYSTVNVGRAPLGLVFINFAGVKTVTIGSRTYTVEGVDLPSVIMTNNFKFDLVKKQTTQAQP